MKKGIILIWSLLVMRTMQVLAQSTNGTDFWVAFMPNYTDEGAPSVKLNLVVTAQQTSSVTVENPRTGWSEMINVDAGESSTINIPNELAYFQDESDCVLDNAFHVTCKNSISVFASNDRDYSFDVFNVLPTHVLGSEYILQVYPRYASPMKPERLASEFAIVAVEDNTVVEIDLTFDSQNGHYAHQPFSVTLNEGQCYQLQCLREGEGDLSGTRITATNNKPIAVFAGDRGCLIPDYFSEAVDAAYEQMIPIEYWGKQFIVTPTMIKGVDRVRVTALNDNCQINVNGEWAATIESAETFEFVTYDAQPAAYIETSEPVLVHKFLPGAMYNYQGNNYCDPSMVYICPLDRSIHHATFPTFGDSKCEFFFVNIVAETTSVPGISLNGQSIDSYFREVPGNPDYSFARIGINNETQTLSSSLGGFVAHAYGLGPCVSYAFSVGADLSWHNVHVAEYEPDSITTAYPNPGCNTLNIRTSLQNAHVEVYDMNGRLVQSQVLTEPVTAIDTKGWIEGIYVWKVTNNGKETNSRKWIKK